MTQSRLAELAGMSQAAISRLEHGKCMPTFYLLEKIAEALNSVLVVAIGPGRRVAVEFRNGPERAGAAG
ncbi:helix-turn-helix transcriptional regulator [Streptomyces sp. SID9727]|nr:helix-turn-helix transcriptional regulator [Streptomyces sp. SID9727]